MNRSARLTAIAVVAASIASAYVVSTPVASADKVTTPNYRAVEGVVGFGSQSGGLLTASASGLRTRFELTPGRVVIRECYFTGQSANADGGKGYSFLSGWVPVKEDGTWSTRAWGPNQTTPIANGDYQVSVICNGLPGENGWGALTDPPKIGISIDGSGPVRSQPNNPKRDWIADSVNFAICLGGFGALLAVPIIIALRLGGVAAVKGLIKPLVTFSPGILLPAGSYVWALTETLKKCSSSVLHIDDIGI